MPINLSKGQKVDLTKKNPGLKNIMVGLGWDVNAFDSGADFDLDAAAFMLGSNGKCPTEKEFIFYGNLEHASGAVKHMGDNLTGEGEGDDEQIEVKLPDIPSNVEKIAFTVTIYDSDVRRQNFGQVSNSFIRIVDMSTDTELIRYDLGEDFSIETAVVVGELYRHNGEWKFNAVGQGTNDRSAVRALWNRSCVKEGMCDANKFEKRPESEPDKRKPGAFKSCGGPWMGCEPV